MVNLDWLDLNGARLFLRFLSFQLIRSERGSIPINVLSFVCVCDQVIFLCGDIAIIGIVRK